MGVNWLRIGTNGTLLLIVGNTKALIKSYLEDRYQRVLIDEKFSQSHTTSSWDKINHGVPQGSILGPIIFLLYINDLPKIMKGISKPILFVDDTSIIVSDPNPVNFQNNLISSFEQLNVWFNANLLSLNFNKTQYIQFKTTNSTTMQIDLCYNNKHIVNNTHTLNS
jgi:hypothetical protein